MLIRVTKVVFTLELVWPTSRVEPELMGWCEQKKKKKNLPRVENFNPGNCRVQPGFDTGLTRIKHNWTEISDYDPGYRKWETWQLSVRDSMSCWNWPKRVVCITCLIPCNFLRLLAQRGWCFRRFFTTNHCCILPSLTSAMMEQGHRSLTWNR